MSPRMRLLQLELLRSARSLRVSRVLLALVFASLTSAALGAALVGQHRSAAARDQEASSARRVELAKGGRPAGSGLRELPRQSALELGIWQDTLIGRALDPAAFWVAADLAALPDSAVLRIHEPPLAVPALAERSFATALLGTFDLAWLLALLLPLAAIGLGYDLIARDRERGTLAMLLGAAPSPYALIGARAITLTSILALATLPALLAGVVLCPLLAGAVLPLSALASALLLLLAYDTFLASVVVAASALAERSSGALASLLAAWILCAFALPIAGASTARALVPDPDPRLRLMGEQAAADVYNQPSPAVIATEAERDPELAPDRGSDGATSQNRVYFLLAHERYRRAKGARAAESRALADRAELLELFAWLSPISACSLALADLAGAAPSARSQFLAEAEAHRVEIERFVRGRVIANQAELDDPQAWPAFVSAPHTELGPALIAAAVYATWAVALLIVAAIGLSRRSLAPTRAS